MTVLSVEGEGTVTLDGGLLLHTEGTSGQRPEAREDCDDERLIVAQWLEANSDRVRILEVESHLGLAVPAVRIPRLDELRPVHTEDCVHSIA